MLHPQTKLPDTSEKFASLLLFDRKKSPDAYRRQRPFAAEYLHQIQI